MRKGSANAGSAPINLVWRHLRLGWFTILGFLTLGIALEALHGFKVDAYLNLANETRRLMWTLAHAHGVLLGLLHLGFGFTLQAVNPQSKAWPGYASLCLCAATVLLPGGFLLGGTITYGGDPGRGILLVPVGAAFLFTAVLVTAIKTVPPKRY